MQVIKISYKNEFTINQKLSVALGNFDGVHVAHQELIKNVMLRAQQLNYSSGVLTFEPHPASVLYPEKKMKRLLTLEQKLSVFKELKLDYVFIIEFDNMFAKMSAQEFVKEILVNLINAKHVVTGCNFHFGANRLGTTSMLTEQSYEYSFTYQCIRLLKKNYFNVSSSTIKKFLQSGSMGIVNSLLGRHYKIIGKVEKGSGLAKKELGIHTANIVIDNDKSATIEYPAYGVYLAKVVICEESYFGLVNLGKRPTVEKCNENQKIVLEAHLFDFEQNLYGAVLEVHFLQLLRPERKFGNLSELSKQIILDISHAKYEIVEKFSH